MAASNIASGVRSAVCDAFVDAIDSGGAGDNLIASAAFAATLVVLPFSATAFGAASTGVATANTITTTAIDTTGTAAVARIRNGSDATHSEWTVGTSGTDYVFSTTSFVATVNASISSMTITMPASG